MRWILNAAAVLSFFLSSQVLASSKAHVAHQPNLAPKTVVAPKPPENKAPGINSSLILNPLGLTIESVMTPPRCGALEFQTTQPPLGEKPAYENFNHLVQDHTRIGYKGVLLTPTPSQPLRITVQF